METILLAFSGWLITALLIAKAGTKLNKKFLPTFLFSFLLTPIAGLIYMNMNNESSNKKTKRGGPWSPLIAKAEEAQNNEEYSVARSYYQNALKELQDPDGAAKYYYKKYILSKISEVNYALTLLENKKDKQVPFRNVESSPLQRSMENLGSQERATSVG